jgi:arginase
VVWVDAHADINTVECTVSVMSLVYFPNSDVYSTWHTFLLGIGSKIPEFSWLKAILKPEHLVYIELGDVDAGEKRILKDMASERAVCTQVDRYGIGRVVEMALDYVDPNRDLPIHLSFDVDALDPSATPSTGTPVRHTSLLFPKLKGRIE